MPWVPAAGAQSYSIDQSRYFASPEIEAAQRQQRLDEAAGFPAVAPVDPAGLGDYLHRAEVLLSQLERHGAYLHLRASRDMDDRIADTLDLLTERAEGALRTLGGAAFAKVAAANPSLRRYTYLLARAERNRPHELPEEQEAIVHELAEHRAPERSRGAIASFPRRSIQGVFRAKSRSHAGVGGFGAGGESR